MRKRLAVPLISYVEVLGFYGISAQEKTDFESFFRSVTVFPLTADISRNAVELRQTRKCGLGDSIVAATALVEGCTLVTRNVKDFK